MTTILGISGSLRSASFNTALLHAAAPLLPDGVELVVHDLADIPLYNSDLTEPPAGVTRLKDAIASADGLLIATPEYNYSVPGVLKNAIDWVSRPAYKSVVSHKPTAIVSAAMSFVGGARAQQHLKTILLGMATPVFAYPELLVGSAHQKFEDGKLTDEATTKFLGDFVRAFAESVSR